MNNNKINKFTLKNGLRVLHIEDTTTPLVTVNTLYNVGAKDEDPNRTGLAHLMEHLMFGGSVYIPNFDEVLHNAGGEDNAWTSNDETNYYETLPANNIETALYLESDRMNCLNFSEESLNVQRKVVCEEFKQSTLNKPYGDLNTILRKMVFKNHPYKWQTIGKELSHIENVSLDIVKDFFYKHYAPNNAIISIVGNISFEKTKSLVEKWFQDIPERNLKKREINKEPDQTSYRKESVERNVPNSILVKAYRAPNIYDENYYTSDFITDILAFSESSILPQNLVINKHLFKNIDAYVGSLYDEGLIIIKGQPSEGISLSEAELYIDQELQKLTKKSIKEEDLTKIKNIYEAEKLYPCNTEHLAREIAKFELIDDANSYYEQIQKHNQVTPDQIKNLSNQIFQKHNCSCLYYKAQ